MILVQVCRRVRVFVSLVTHAPTRIFYLPLWSLVHSFSTTERAHKRHYPTIVSFPPTNIQGPCFSLCTNLEESLCLNRSGDLPAAAWDGRGRQGIFVVAGTRGPVHEGLSTSRLIRCLGWRLLAKRKHDTLWGGTSRIAAVEHRESVSRLPPEKYAGARGQRINGHFSQRRFFARPATTRQTYHCKPVVITPRAHGSWLICHCCPLPLSLRGIGTPQSRFANSGRNGSTRRAQCAWFPAAVSPGMARKRSCNRCYS